MVCSEYVAGSWRARWSRGIARVIACATLITVVAVGGPGRNESLAAGSESSVSDMPGGTDGFSQTEDFSQSADAEVGVGTVGAVDSAPDGNRVVPVVVYSNTGPTNLYRPEAFRRIADDLRTISTCGCPLNSYEIRVGGVPGFGGYTVETGIYDDCPSFGGQLIAGTEEIFVIPDEAEYTLTKTIAPAVVNIPRNVWLGVTFDSNFGGWLVGTPAEIGTTFDFFDFPFFPCEATTGIAGRYGGFWTRLLCDGVGGLAAPAGPSPADSATDVYPIVDLEWNGGPAARTTPHGDAQSSEPPVWNVDPDWMDNLEPGQWCGTQERYEATGHGQRDGAGRLVCPTDGICDDAVARDGFIPTVDTPFTTYRVYLNIFCRDNGTACTSSAAEVAAQMVTLNANYEPWKIQFEYDFRFVNDTQQRDFGSTGDEALMKTTYAVDPDIQCNVYVVSTGGSSWGTFPWDPNTLTAFGGIVMGDTQFSSSGQTLAHEMGHNLGLWHTHHGVSEVTTCGDCYEYANDPSDDTGDFCSDTRPTPTNFNCGPPGGVDCTGTGWGTTDFRNYMGYAPSSCYTNFSDQQAGRFHCWSETELSTWQVPPECDLLYDVYFDDFSPPTSLLCEGISSPTCDPGPLDCATTYYWQVVANLGTTGGSEIGSIWSFDTPTGPDCNTNGTVDACDIAFGGLPDCNSDGIPDDCHADSDGDGVPDPCDICAGGDDNADGDGDGVPDFCDPCPLDNPDDSDADGVCDSDDICPGGDDNVDFDGDTVPDFCDACPLDNPDDSDGDGVCDSDDICPGGDDTVDTDGDAVPDFCDTCPLDNPNDTDGDGVCDSDDPCPLDNPDDADSDTVCDSDDNCELANPDQADCQPNGVGDVCDIAIGGMPDNNGNGVPDECEFVAPEPPLATDEMSVPGANPWPPAARATTCVDDSGCANEAVCIADASGGFPGTCYVPKNRYLAVEPNPATDAATALRLSVQLSQRLCEGTGSTCTMNSQCAVSCDDLPIPCASDGECNALALGATCASTGTCVQVLGWFGAPDAKGYASVVVEANRHYEIWKDGQYPIDCGANALCPANAYCHTGLGGSVTCKWSADDTEVKWTYVFLGDCHVSPMIRDVVSQAQGGLEENKAERYYLIEAILETSNIADASAYSTALILPTVRVWGDSVGASSGGISTPPNGLAGFTDVLHQVFRFKDTGQSHLSWLDLHDQDPNRLVGFQDMLDTVNGFKDKPYPYDDPCTCAGLATPCP